LAQKGSTAAAESVAARRQAAARNALQEQQRLVSREKLLIAAGNVFKKKTYAAAAVKDILHEAKISRGTFYGHFSGKYAVVEALFEGLAPSLHNVFEQLGQLKRLDQANVERWLEKLLAVYEKNKDLFVIMGSAWSTEMTADNSTSMGPWEKVIDSLSTKFPAFALAKADTPKGREVRFRLTMLLSTIGSFCHIESVHHPAHFRDIGVKVIAEEILRFINLGDEAPAKSKKSARTNKK
jgi:AcrR family transcriptional regulator